MLLHVCINSVRLTELQSESKHLSAHLPECSEEKGEEGPQEGEVGQQKLDTLPAGVAPQDIKAEHREGGTL